MAGPILFNMKWYRGQAVRMAGQMLDADGDPDDITGDTFTFTVRRGPLNIDGEVIEFHGREGWELTGEDTTAVITKTTETGGIVITGAATGLIEITVTATDTLLLDADDYSFDLFRTNVGAEAPLTVGTIRVMPSVRA